jgi:hypothetical protein
MIVQNNSILNLMEQTTIDDTIVAWRMKSLPAVPFYDDDMYHQYIWNDRLDKISYKYYGSVYFNWFIALANNIKLEMDIEIGTVLRIPSFTSLLKYIGSAK